MRAVICMRYGPPEALRLAEVERPTPRRNQVCIRIFATAVTVSDCLIRGLKVPGRYRILLRMVVGMKAPRRPIIGMVLAGDHRYVELGHKKGNVIVTVGRRP